MAPLLVHFYSEALCRS